MSSPSLDRMNRSPSPTQLERGRGNLSVLREQHERDRINSIQQEQIMANRENSPMGFARTDTSKAEAALKAWGDLNTALDEAVDEIEKAFARDRQSNGANAPDRDDLHRAPVLGNRRGGVR